MKLTPLKQKLVVVSLIISIGILLYAYSKYKHHAEYEVQKDRFTQTSSVYVDRINSLNKQIQEKRKAFALEDYSELEGFQNVLGDIFPYGTTVSDVDALLVDEMGMFRSDNLIGNDELALYNNGSSSSKNYIFYYKPIEEQGAQGWEETSSGWVVKIVHGHIVGNRDNEIQIMTGGSKKGLKEIYALAVPDITGEKFSDGVFLAKEVLQFKIDSEVKDNFDEREWQALLEKHSSSPCIEDFKDDCLFNQAFGLLGIPEGKTRRSYLSYLAEATITHGNIYAAKELLKTWPTGEQIRAENAKLSRLQRPSELETERSVRKFSALRMQLLLLAGQYKPAIELLIDFQEAEQTGIDYGATNVLVKRGDLEKALELAKLTLDWKRITPDPNRNSSAHMHCNNYTHPVPRPTALGDLAEAFLKKEEVNTAYEITQMIKLYWENKAFGQSSYCYTSFAESAYVKIMVQLFEFYAEKGDTSRAHSIFKELQKTLQTQLGPIKSFNKRNFEYIASIAAKHGITESLDALAKHIDENNQLDYIKGNRRRNNDPVPLIYALSGQKEKAIRHIEKQDYSEAQTSTKKIDVIFGLDKAPTNEVKLTTYLRIAQKLAEVGDKEGALIFLEKASQHFNSRTSEYDTVIKNLEDYIIKANILLDLEMETESRAVLTQILEQIEENQSGLRDVPVTRSFYGRVAYLFAQHEHISNVQAWADGLPSFYLGAYYASIANLLIEEGRWEELDTFEKEMARVFASDKNPIINWRSFTKGLINAGEFDRFFRFMDSLEQPSEADIERQGKRMGTYPKIRTLDTPDTRQQIWMMSQLFAAHLIEEDIPENVIHNIWPRYIRNCKNSGNFLPTWGVERTVLANAREVMAGCYVGMIQQKINYLR